MQDTTTVRLRIFGTVQGVGYRAWAQDEARRRGLAGWVKNENDGSVTAVFHGPSGDVSDLTGEIDRGGGPPASDVTSTQMREEAAPPTGVGFEIRH